MNYPLLMTPCDEFYIPTYYTCVYASPPLPTPPRYIPTTWNIPTFLLTPLPWLGEETIPLSYSINFIPLTVIRHRQLSSSHSWASNANVVKLVCQNMHRVYPDQQQMQLVPYYPIAMHTFLELQESTTMSRYGVVSDWCTSLQTRWCGYTELLLKQRLHLYQGLSYLLSASVSAVLLSTA